MISTMEDQNISALDKQMLQGKSMHNCIQMHYSTVVPPSLWETPYKLRHSPDILQDAALSTARGASTPAPPITHVGHVGG